MQSINIGEKHLLGGRGGSVAVTLLNILYFIKEIIQIILIKLNQNFYGFMCFPIMSLVVT
jgi:hypothetical protein